MVGRVPTPGNFLDLYIVPCGIGCLTSRQHRLFHTGPWFDISSDDGSRTWKFLSRLNETIDFCQDRTRTYKLKSKHTIFRAAEVGFHIFRTILRDTLVPDIRPPQALIANHFFQLLAYVMQALISIGKLENHLGPVRM